MEAPESIAVPGLLSIVVPLCNEFESLVPLQGEIRAALTKLPDWRWQLIFVDDGSTDGSWAKVLELSSGEPRIEGLRFRRNFGKAAALEAGFRVAKGQIVFTMDADLQDNPSEIPKFLDAIQAGNDLVSGYKQKRKDPWHKVFPSRVFNSAVSWITGVRLHDHNCGFKAYRAEVVRDIRLYGDLHRFVPVLAAAKGYRVAEVVVKHRPRKFGRSKFGPKRFVQGFLDLLQVQFVTGFAAKPMQFFGTAALVAGFFAACGMALFAITLLLDWFFELRPLYPLAVLGITLALMLFGTQALLAGYLAELLAATRKTEPYTIAERTSASVPTGAPDVEP